MTNNNQTGTPETGSTTKRTAQRVAKIAAVVAVIAMALALAAKSGERASRTSYTTAPAAVGNLTVVVSATGNLQPTIQVDVGSELSGTVQEVLVNDNDAVQKGQLLARLDTSKLEDQVFKSEAALMSAKATVTLNTATADEAQVNLDRLKKAWELSGGKVPSKSDITAAEATLKKALASIDNAKAAVTQAEAALRSDKTNLAKAEIRSPIDGVVLLREVEPGQTVAASLQAPVLFVLAQNLKQMELQAQIDEADVGQVHEGQDARFTVDAYPDRSYPATITRVRYGSETTNGVVTYQGVLAVSNDDLSLRPGMTATANITALTRNNVLLVPNAALRFTPPSAEEEPKKSRSVVSFLIPRPPSGGSKKTATTVTRGADQTVWVLKGGQPVAVPVKAGATDGRQTEIVSGDIKAGDLVIIDADEPAK